MEHDGVDGEDAGEDEGGLERAASAESFMRDSAEFLASLAKALDPLNKLISLNQVTPPPAASSSEHVQQGDPDVNTLARLAHILDQYQEQPHLLDPYLDRIVRTSMDALRPVTARALALLDAGDEQAAHALAADARVHAAYRFVYHVTKVRGYKTTVQFFPNDVSLLEPTLRLLLILPPPRVSTPQWEPRYVLLLHLSLLLMAPFDLSTVDSGGWGGIPGPGAPHGSGVKQSLAERAVEVGKEYLSCTGKEGEAAAVALARVVTRKDASGVLLVGFMRWAGGVAKEAKDVFLLKHTLLALSLIHKLGQRDVLLPTLSNTVGLAVDLAAPHPEGSTTRWDPRARSNALVRKLVVKVAGRAGTCYLPVRTGRWLYRRGQRSLDENLKSAEQGGINAPDDRLGPAITNVAPTLPASMGGAMSPNGELSTDDMSDPTDADVPPAIEYVMDLLLLALRDRDTVVRWSAAKSLGRVSARLPHHLASDVVGAVLECFSDDVLKRHNGDMDLAACSDHAWHGGCLALAEMARRGLLLPERLPEALPWVLLALRFDQRRGAHSVGAHVRDAACYALWSFARAYDASHFSTHADTAAAALAVAATLDREVNVRRAASAAFQEGVGRLGCFPRGIDVLTRADYFSVGNRSQSFLNVAPDLARYSEYRPHIVSRLARGCAGHWDLQVRELAAGGLGKVVRVDSGSVVPGALADLVAAAADQDVGTRHGAMLAVGEVCLAWAEARKTEAAATDFTVDELRTVVKPAADIIASQPGIYFQSFGSEHARQAACRLVECLALAGWPAEPRNLAAWWDLVATSLERKEPAVQDRAVAAVRALATRYGCDAGRVEAFLAAVRPEADKVARRGYAMALGVLPADVIFRTGLPTVLVALQESAKVRENRLQNDAEGKRNSVTAMVQVLETIDARDTKARPLDALEAPVVVAVLRTLVECMTDFSTDQRGDVGSWVREASMRGARSALRLAWKWERQGGPAGAGKFLPQDVFRDLVARVLGQAVERIDRVRQTAGECLVDLVWSGVGRGGEEGAAVLRGLDLLEEACPKDSSIAWSNPSDAFFRLVPLLAIPDYRTELLTGQIVSAGGLTESLVRHSTASLLDFVAALPTSPYEPITVSDQSSFAPFPALSRYRLSLSDFFFAVVEVFARNRGTDRVVVPLLEVLDTVIGTGVVADLDDFSVFLDVIELTKNELKRTKDVKKMTAGIKIFCSCATFSSGKNAHKVQVVALQCITAYLFHSFPRVRRSTAEQFYVSLTSIDDDEALQAEDCANGDSDEKKMPGASVFKDKSKLEEFILETDWDQTPSDDLKRSVAGILNLS